MDPPSASRRCWRSGRTIFSGHAFRRLPRDRRAFSAPPRSIAILPRRCWGLAGLWYKNFSAARPWPCCHMSNDLKAVPAYLQQLTMESKRQSTSPLDGTENQLSKPARSTGRAGHQRPAFVYQLIHPGTKLIPCDFIAFIHSLNPLGRITICCWQCAGPKPRALAFGKNAGRKFEPRRRKALGPRAASFRGKPAPRTLFCSDRQPPAGPGKLVALRPQRFPRKGRFGQIDSSTNGGVEA